MKAKKMLFFAVFTAMLFVVNLSFSQVNHKEGDCSKKCGKECTTTLGNQEKSDCPGECKSKTGDSQGVVSDSGKVCVVTGEKIDGTEGEPIKLTYLGKEYEFCCNGCVKKFKSEPMNYIKGGLMCPVMGETADKNISTVVDGV
ncbi:MAG: YHS domain-containing protein [Ignavibacteria bacterium]|jgi:YHS domain-containing protein